MKLLSEYQDRLAAQDSWGALVVLQALDAAGKDGTIRDAMSGSTLRASASTASRSRQRRTRPRLPVALRAALAGARRDRDLQPLALRGGTWSSASTLESLARQRLPKPTTHGDVFERRYREINDWERYLTDNGFRIVKLFLNLSKEAQRERFLRRIDLPDHNWKFSAADVREREFWDDYQDAFSDMLTHTSTDWAPWYVIPADRKWFSRIATSAVLLHTLMEIDPRFPIVTEERRQSLLEVKETLEAEAPHGAAADPFADQTGAHGEDRPDAP